jgi:hypothetical protein
MDPPPAWDVVLTTAHQAVGALVLGCAVALTLLAHRLLAPTEHITAAVDVVSA